MNYLNIIWRKLFSYFYSDEEGFLQFGYDEIPLFDEFIWIEKDEDFDNFKKDEQELNNTIFALNNLSEVVYKTFFEKELEYNIIGSSLLNITLNIEKDVTNINFHNLDKINESHFSRFLYIKTDIIEEGSIMNHVNCIVIDKQKKYILYFEPKYKTVVDIGKIKNLLSKYFDLDEYKFLLSEDIGFTKKTRLQKYDFFCQTYIMFVFWTIVKLSEIGKDIDYSELCTPIIENINTKTLGYFLFLINKKMKENSIILSDIPIIWKFPSKGLRNSINSIKVALNRKNSSTQNIEESQEFHYFEEEDSEENLIIIKKT